MQDASSQHHYTALWFDVPRAYAEDLLAKGPHQVDISAPLASIARNAKISRLPPDIGNDSGNLMWVTNVVWFPIQFQGCVSILDVSVQALLLESPVHVLAHAALKELRKKSLHKCMSPMTQKALDTTHAYSVDDPP